MSSGRTSIVVPLAALITAMVSLQVGASIAKSLFPAIGAEGATTLRLGLSAVFLAVLLKPWRASFTAKNWKAVSLYGASLAGMNLTFYMSLQTIPLGIAIALEFCGPMTVAMLWSRRLIDFLWVGLAVAGLGMLLPFSAGAQALDLRGALLALMAGVCWAIYIVAGQRAGRDHGSLAPGLGVSLAAVIVAPVGLLHAGSSLAAPALLPAAVAVGVLSSALPYTLEMFALRRLPTHTFGILMSLEPALGTLVGFLLLDESLPLLQLGAVAIIVLASAGAALTVKGGTELHLAD